MSWFEEQIKQRKENEEKAFSDSLSDISNLIKGKKKYDDSLDLSKDALYTILNYYGFKNNKEIPPEVKDINEKMDYLYNPVGLMRREVRLTKGWYKDCVGAILGFKEENNEPVALLPSLFGYKYLDNGKYININRKNESLFSKNGFCFYKPLPNRKINSIDLIKYAFSTRSAKEIVIILSFMGISTLIGLLIPKISYFLYGEVVTNKSVGLLFSTVVFFISVNISTLLFKLFESMYNEKINSKTSLYVETATMMRILSLPTGFFRKYSSGELAQRRNYVSNLSEVLMNTIFNTGFTSLFSLAYISSIFKYARGLVVPSLIIIAVTMLFTILTSIKQTKISKEQMNTSAKLSGNTYSMFKGIQKIRLSGSEKRMFARWAKLFTKNMSLLYNSSNLLTYNGTLSLAISLVGTMVMYYFATKTGVSLAEYNAFNSAYGMVFGAFSSLSSIAITIAQIKPILEMAKPIMDEEPETSENKDTITSLHGAIELNNVSFRYSDNMPMVIDELSLKIKPGQYVAIVGKTGCGKSTLIRLLLGFEKPLKGSIYYDGKDINDIELKSLRRKIGTVMQDGKLFQGDIFSNITISAPWLTLKEAWEAAEIAGIADDIRDMPMGMNTLISEGAGGISGGQRQRLLIARAIVSKPRVLIFDEATSALDNITQKQVSEALDKLKCTRIVIAHRLSTIKNCDRIIYLEDGKIKEEGTYEELIQKNGLFKELIDRQRIETK